MDMLHEEERSMALLIGKHKTMLIVSAAALLLVLILFFAGENKENSDRQAAADPFKELTKAKDKDAQKPVKEQAQVMIDVKGAVQKPGVYEMAGGKRVMDAVQRAGGFTEGAAKEMVNLAQRLQDEMVIVIPLEGEESQLPAIQTSGKGTGTESTQININTASQEELETLPGIGPSKAKAIIQHREENGSFSSAEDITSVSGIGKKTFENLKDAIVAP